MRPLTHDEALTRAHLITVDAMSVTLDVTATEFFASTSVISFSCSRSGASTFVDCHAASVESIRLNGQPVDLGAWDEGRITLADLSERNELVVEATMAYSHDGEGLVRHVDPADHQAYLYAMSFLDAAPRWFTCFDQPDLKAPYAMTIRAPREWIVFGTGETARTATEGDVSTWNLAQPIPLSTYVVAITAGPYVGCVTSHDGIILGLHTRASMADELARSAEDIFAVTKQSFDRYHELFGMRYPFGRYHQVFVPDFNAGAMENPGCIVLRDSLLFRGASTKAARGSRAATIAHEMAHQWFGDLVTMRWWDNLWLNESFAEYMGHRICEDATEYPQWVGFGLSRKFSGIVADQAPTTHPVAASEVENSYQALENFDSISYSKGASLVRQLNALMGDEIFFAGLRAYFARHAQSNAEIGDLLAAWEQAGAPALTQWAESWLQTSGMDRLEMRVQGDAVHLGIFGAHPRDHALDVVALAGGGQVVAREHVVASTPGLIVADHIPGAVWFCDEGDLAWGHRRPSVPWAQMPALSLIVSPDTRTALYAALCDTVHTLELAPAEAIDIIVANATTETDDTILRHILSTAVGYCGGALAPELRPVQRARLAAVSAEIHAAAEPQTDRQLVSLLALIETTDNVAFLHGLLEGKGVRAGVTVDAELRWKIITRLVSMGEGLSLIDEELARDSSSTAIVAATRARASSPLLKEKERAYDIVMRDSMVRPDVVYAAASGLFLPEHEETVLGLAEQWFVDLVSLSGIRNGWLLSRTVSTSFPVEISCNEILAAAKGVLEDDSLHPLVRRAVLDRADELERKIHLRAI